MSDAFQANIPDSLSTNRDLANLTFEGETCAVVRWMGGSKTLILLTRVPIPYYSFRGYYLTTDEVVPSFLNQANVLADTQLAINRLMSGGDIGDANITANGPLYLGNNKSIAFDASFIKTGEDNWQFLLKADALSPIL